jgi:protein-tyrosine-phosphatase
MKVQKLITILTTACFLVSFIFAPAIDAGMEMKREMSDFRQMLDGFVIPPAVGRVSQGKYFGSEQVVVNIQDLHCHPEVQRNISRILSILDRKCDLKSVFVEGAYGNVDTSWLSNIKEKDLREKIIETLIDKGDLTGSEYYSVKVRKTGLLKGLEDKNLHTANIVRLGKILEKKAYYEGKLGELGKELAFLEAKYYSVRNKRFNRAVAEYKRGEMDADRYYRLLMKYAARINADPDRFNNVFTIRMGNYGNITKYLELMEQGKKLRYKRVAYQLQEFVQVLKSKLPYNAYNYLLQKTDNFSNLDDLYVCLAKIAREYQLDLRENYPDLREFFAYAEKSREINPLALIKEEKRLVEEIRMGLAQDTNELEVSFLEDFESYFRDYLLNRLTMEDYEYYVKRSEEFKTILKKYTMNDVLGGLESDFALLDEYYKVNCGRNNSFMKNIFGEQEAAMAAVAAAPAGTDFGDIENIVKSLNKNNKVTVVVTGGFHTEGLEKLIEERRISYLAVTPNVTQDTRVSDLVYTEMARQQARILSNSLALGLASQMSSPEMFRLAMEAANQELDGVAFTRRNMERLVDTLAEATGIDPTAIQLNMKDGGDKATIVLNGKTITLTRAEAGTRAEMKGPAGTGDSAATIAKVEMEQLTEVLKSVLNMSTLISHIPAAYSILKNLMVFAIAHNIVIGDGLIYRLASDPENKGTIDGLPSEIVGAFPEAMQEIVAEHLARVKALDAAAQRNELLRLLIAGEMIRNIVISMRSSAADQGAAVPNTVLTQQGREQAAGKKTKDDIRGGLIGKYRVISKTTYDPQAKTLHFTGRDIETGEEKQIALRNVQFLDKETYVQSIIQNVRFICDDDIVESIVDWFEDQLYSEHFGGEMITFDNGDEYGIHGIGMRCIVDGVEKNIVGLSSKFKGNGIAWFHEMAELMGAAGALDAETIAANLKNRSWYDAHAGRSGREELKLHYAIRALQREAFLNLDSELTYVIKGRLSSREIDKTIKECGARYIDVIKEFRTRRVDLGTRDQEIELLRELTRNAQEMRRAEEQRRQKEEEENRQREERLRVQKQQVDRILDDMRQLLGATYKTYGQHEEEAVKLLKGTDQYDADLVAETVVGEIISLLNERQEAYSFSVNPYKNFMLRTALKNLAPRTSALVLKKLLDEAASNTRNKALLEGLANQFLNMKGYQVGQIDEFWEALIRYAKQAFAKKPSVQRYEVEDIRDYKRYFDADPSDPSVLYFKEDFWERIVWIRDMNHRKRLHRLYKEAIFRQEKLSDVFGGLLLRDQSGHAFELCLGEIEKGGMSDVAEEKIISLLALRAGGAKSNHEKQSRLIDALIRAYRKTGRAKLLSSLLIIAPGIDSESEAGKVFEFLKSINGALFDEMGAMVMRLKKADREYEAKQQQPGVTKEQIEAALHNVWKVQIEIEQPAEAMQQSVAILSAIAQNFRARPEGNNFAEALLRYLTDVVRDDRWDSNIHQEIISELRPFVNMGNEQVLEFLMRQVRPDMAAADETSFLEILSKNPSDEQIRDILSGRTAKIPVRAGYLILMRYQQRKGLLEDVIVSDSRTMDIRFRIYAFALYASRFLTAKTPDGHGGEIVNYDEDMLAKMLSSLADDAEGFLRSRVKDDAAADSMFDDIILQNEESITCNMAVLIALQNRLKLLDGEGFVKTAGTLSNTRIRGYWYNANSNFVIGGRLIPRGQNSAASYFMTIAHELMHEVLYEEHRFAPIELRNGILHELLADEMSEYLANLFGIDFAIEMEKMNYRKHRSDVENDDYYSVEVHEGARAQKTFIDDVLRNRGLTLVPERFIAAALKIITDTNNDGKNLEEVISAVLVEYFGIAHEQAKTADDKMTLESLMASPFLKKMMFNDTDAFDERAVRQKVLEMRNIEEIVGRALEWMPAAPVVELSALNAAGIRAARGKGPLATLRTSRIAERFLRFVGVFPLLSAGARAAVQAFDEQIMAPVLELQRFARLLALYRLDRVAYDKAVAEFYRQHGYDGSDEARFSAFKSGMAGVMAQAAAPMLGVPGLNIAQIHSLVLLITGHADYNRRARAAWGEEAPVMRLPVTVYGRQYEIPKTIQLSDGSRYEGKESEARLEEDINAIREIHVAKYGQEYESVDKAEAAFDRMFKADYESALINTNAMGSAGRNEHILLYRNETGRIGGYAHIRMESGVSDGKKYRNATLSELEVLPEYRGTGIEKALWVKRMELLQASDVSIVKSRPSGDSEVEIIKAFNAMGKEKELPQFTEGYGGAYYFKPPAPEQSKNSLFISQVKINSELTGMYAASAEILKGVKDAGDNTDVIISMIEKQYQILRAGTSPEEKRELLETKNELIRRVRAPPEWNGRLKSALRLLVSWIAEVRSTKTDFHRVGIARDGGFFHLADNALGRIPGHNAGSSVYMLTRDRMSRELLRGRGDVGDQQFYYDMKIIMDKAVSETAAEDISALYRKVRAEFRNKCRSDLLFEKYVAAVREELFALGYGDKEKILFIDTGFAGTMPFFLKNVLDWGKDESELLDEAGEEKVQVAIMQPHEIRKFWKSLRGFDLAMFSPKERALIAKDIGDKGMQGGVEIEDKMVHPVKFNVSSNRIELTSPSDQLKVFYEKIMAIQMVEAYTEEKTPLGKANSIKRKIDKNEPVTVCFACAANTNHSAVAHVLFQDRLNRSGKSNVDIISAGLMVSRFGNQDAPLDNDLKRILAGIGVSRDVYDSFHSEQFNAAHAQADIIVAASEGHRQALLRAAPALKGKVVLFTELFPGLERFGAALPDPAAGEISKSGLVTLMQKAIDGFLGNEQTPAASPAGGQTGEVQKNPTQIAQGWLKKLTDRPIPVHDSINSTSGITLSMSELREAVNAGRVGATEGGRFYRLDKDPAPLRKKSRQTAADNDALGAILPENLPLVNQWANEGKSPFGIALRIAAREFVNSFFAPRDFIAAHKDQRGARRVVYAGVGAGIAAGIIAVLSAGFAAPLLALVTGAAAYVAAGSIVNVGTHVWVDYHYVDDTGLTTAVKEFGAANMDENGDVHTPVYIREGLPQDPGAWGLRNTGLNINGKPVWASTREGALVIFTGDVDQTRVTGEINELITDKGQMAGSRRLSERLKVLFKAAGVDLKGMGFKPGMIIDHRATGKKWWYNEDGTMVVTRDWFSDGVDLAESISTGLGELMTIRNAEAVKLAEDIYYRFDNVKEYDERCRLYLNASNKAQNRQLIVSRELAESWKKQGKVNDITGLARRNGVKILVDLGETGDTKENVDRYVPMGFTGYLVTRNGEAFIRDFTLNDVLKVDVVRFETVEQLKEGLGKSGSVHKVIELSDLEKLSTGGDRSILNRVAVFEILKTNILSLYSADRLTKDYVAGVAHAWDREQLPALPQDTAALTGAVASGDTDAILAALNIEGSHAIKRYLEKLAKDVEGTAKAAELNELTNAFLKGIVEKMLAKAKLEELDLPTKYGLADAKLERILGQMLLRQKTGKTEGAGAAKTAEQYEKEIGDMTAEEAYNRLAITVNDLAQKAVDGPGAVSEAAKQERARAINALIELIPLYGEPRQLENKREVNRPFNARAVDAMLGAA